MLIKRLTTLLFSFLLITILLSSCKKDTSAPINVTISKVRSQIITSSSGLPDTTIYTYDNTGRLYTSLEDTLLTTYTYGSNTVTVTSMLAGRTFLTIYNTNSRGLATSDSKSFVYKYSSWDYLTSLSYTGTGIYDSTLYFVSGGNVDNTVRHQVDSATDNLVTTTYTYLSIIDSRDYGLSFLGKQSTNLINTETITQVINGSTYTIRYTYSYTFDNKGRVTQQVRSSGTATYTTAYAYF